MATENAKETTDVPKRKVPVTKAANKKTAPKKIATKKPAAKKSSASSAAAKPTAKKPAAKKTASKPTSSVRKIAEAVTRGKSNETLDRVVGEAEQMEQLARKIWLAGLGAYGKSFDELQSQYEKVTHESADLFEKLVERGEEIQDGAESSLEKNRKMIEENIEKRIDEVRKTVASASSKFDLSARLAKVSEKLEEVAAELKSKDD